MIEIEVNKDSKTNLVFIVEIFYRIASWKV